VLRSEIELHWCWSCDFNCEFLYDERRDNWLCRRCGKALLRWGQKMVGDVRWKNDDGGIMGVCASYQREHRRFSVEIPFDYSRLDRVEEYGGFLANASERGLLVYLPELVERGALLRIMIPFAQGPEFSTIKGTAKVVWGNLSPNVVLGKHRYGLEFQSFNRGSFDKFKIMLNGAEKAHEGKGP